MERRDTSGYRLTDAQAQEVARIHRDIRKGRGTLATEEQMALEVMRSMRPFAQDREQE